MDRNPFVGTWAYRSFLNDPDLSQKPDKLLFGQGSLVVEPAEPELLKGTIGGDGWSLALHGSRAYGSPMQVRFQGRGLVGGEEWVYDYIGWLVPVWPNSDASLQRPAGVVASFYAVRQD